MNVLKMTITESNANANENKNNNISPEVCLLDSSTNSSSQQESMSVTPLPHDVTSTLAKSNFPQNYNNSGYGSASHTPQPTTESFDIDSNLLNGSSISKSIYVPIKGRKEEESNSSWRILLSEILRKKLPNNFWCRFHTTSRPVSIQTRTIGINFCALFLVALVCYSSIMVFFYINHTNERNFNHNTVKQMALFILSTPTRCFNFIFRENVSNNYSHDYHPYQPQYWHSYSNYTRKNKDKIIPCYRKQNPSYSFLSSWYRKKKRSPPHPPLLLCKDNDTTCHEKQKKYHRRARLESYYDFPTKDVSDLTSSSPDSSKIPKLVIAGKLRIKEEPANIAEMFLDSGEWSTNDRIQLSLYFSYSGGEVYSLLANHSHSTGHQNKNSVQQKNSNNYLGPSSNTNYQQYQSELVVVGAFDTTYSNSQVAYCSVGSWDGSKLSKVGEGLCNSALSRGMKITTAAFSGPYDVFVAGSFKTQVWNGYRHKFVKIFNIAHYNALTQVWLPLPDGHITCSWCTVTILAMVYDSKREQLHITGKFNAIDGKNIPAGLAIFDLKSGRLKAHPGGGLCLLDTSKDGVGTALQLDEEKGILYVMGSFERLTARPNDTCYGLASYDINNNLWTCLADDAHSVLPSGGNNMLLTPFGLMVAGRTPTTTTWPDPTRPYTIALLKYKNKKNADSSKKRNSAGNNDNKNLHYSYNNTKDFYWLWLPGFKGSPGPLHSLSNGVQQFKNTVFIGGDNYVAKYFYEERSVVESKSSYGANDSNKGSHSAQMEKIPVTVDLGKGLVRGQIMAIAQLTPIETEEIISEKNPLMTASNLIALGAFLGLLLMMIFNKKLNQTITSFLFDRDSHSKGISLDTLMYSPVENTNVAEAYQRAMQTRSVQHPHLLTLINPHEIILHRIIGEGTFGRVWSAKWRSSSVAVKEFVFAQAAVAGKSAQQREIIEEIIGEAGMMAILRHPNVLQLFGCSLTSQAIWIISELMSLGSLRQVLDERDKDLPIELKVNIALQVAEGMMYLHGQEPPIIHRDLKSHNIFIHETYIGKDQKKINGKFEFGNWLTKKNNESYDESEDLSSRGSAPSTAGMGVTEISSPLRNKNKINKGNNSEPTIIAKIGDWGSARATLAGSRTMTHGVGTACWLAPEVITHARSSKHSDVYGYGIVLWELATREEVYSELESTQIIAKVADDNLRPPVPKDCPWNDLMVQCWSREPTDRPDFTEIVSYLENLLESIRNEETEEISPLIPENTKNYSSFES